MGMALRFLPLALLVLLALGAGFLAGRGTAVPPPPTSGPSAADLTGRLRVIDGDTFDLAGTRIRLHGVDAPEDAQTCLDEAGLEWACGDWVTREARALWEGEEAACEVLDADRYGRAVSRCAVGGEDLGATLVGRGMALAYVDYSKDYLPQQHAAEAARAGLWRGTFQAPWDWRRDPEPGITDVVVLSAEEPGGAGDGAGDGDGACAIKGNISGSGRIYHLPGGRSYDRTAIDESAGERWFCSVEEAEAAGWRAARG